MADNLKLLIERARQGDQRAIQMILLKLRPLIHRIASKYKSRDSQDYHDLFQEASLTAVKCIEKFDLDYGDEFKAERFYSYARVSMDHAAICYLQQFDVVAVPRRLWQIRNLIEKEKPDDVSAFCQKHDISENRFFDAKNLISSARNAPRTIDFEIASQDIPEALDSEFVERLIGASLGGILAGKIDNYSEFFDERSLRIFNAVFIEDKDTAEVAKEWEMEPSRVRYIAVQTLKNVKELLLDLGVKREDFM